MNNPFREAENLEDRCRGAVAPVLRGPPPPMPAVEHVTGINTAHRHKQRLLLLIVLMVLAHCLHAYNAMRC